MKSINMTKILYSMSIPPRNLWNLTFMFSDDILSPPINTYATNEGIISNPTLELIVPLDKPIS